MHNQPNETTDNLNDAQLLEREWLQRDEFERLERLQPEFRNTTYGGVRASAALVKSWERWWSTNLAARARGILSRVIGR